VNNKWESEIARIKQSAGAWEPNFSQSLAKMLANEYKFNIADFLMQLKSCEMEV